MIARAASLVAAASLTAVAAPAPALAEPAGTAAATAPGLRADVEVDPTAYVLGGYSLHVGLGYQRLRVDLGAFAMEVPAAIHGNDGVTQFFDGFGAKLQYFPFAAQRGGFAGVDAGVSHVLARRDGTDLAARQTQLSAGVHAGWRFLIAADFYATAWVGVSRQLGADDVMLGGEPVEAQRWVVFPAIHLGYRIR